MGGTATKFFTAGKDLLHSYAVGAGGALGSQLGQEPVFDYAGNNCGNATNGLNGAVLDHSGPYMFVLLESGDPQADCSAYQTYKINGDG